MANKALVLAIAAKFDDRELKKATSTLKDFGDNAALAIGAAFAAAGVAAFQFGKEAITAAEGVEVANNRLGQIAESMGIFGAQTQAVTDRLIAYAEANEMNLGTDAELIKATQAKLLTFQELATSADEAGGAFDRATQAAIDLAAAGFGSAESNATQLGKALQDPVKGLTALTRSGVTFTEEQKNLIKSLVESGDVLTAQDMILEAIETQVGGTAAATATASEKISLAFGNMSETVGAALLPVLDELIPVLEEILPVIGEQLVAAVNSVPWEKVVTDLANFAGWVIQNIDGLKRIAEVLAIAAGLYMALSVAVNTAKLASALMVGVQAALTAAFGATAGATTTATTALRVFKAALITTGVGAIVVALGYVAEGFMNAASSGEELNNVDTSSLEGNLGNVETALDNVGIAAQNARGQILNIPNVREGFGLSFGRFGIEPGKSPFEEIPKKEWSGSSAKQATKDAVQEFLDNMQEELDKQAASIKLSNIGLSQPLIEKILGSGDDWQAILDHIVKGGKAAAEEMQNLFDQTEEGIKATEEAAKKAAEEMAAMAEVQLAFYDRLVAKYEENQRQIAELNSAVEDVFNTFNQSGAVVDSMGEMEQAVYDLTSALKETIAAQETSLISARNQKKLQQYLDTAGAQMQAVARQRDELAQRLSDAKDVFKEYFDSILGSVDITQFKGKSDSIIKQLRRQVEAQAKFQEDIKKLRASGLSQTALEQIQKAGVEAGGATAKALLQGGQGAIDEVNSLYAQLGDIANSAAESQVGPMFGAGVNMADGLIAGLEARQAELDAVALALATQFQNTFERALGQGINRVSEPASAEAWAAFSAAYAQAQMALIGTLRPGQQVQYGPGDLVNGIQLPSQPVSPNPGGPGNITINLNAGFGVDGQDVGRKIVDEIKKYERRNGAVFVPAVM